MTQRNLRLSLTIEDSSETETMKLSEVIKQYGSRAEVLAQQFPDLNQELSEEECEWQIDKAFARIMGKVCPEYAKKVVLRLKKEKKRGCYHLVCLGEKYNWIGYCRNIQNAQAHNGTWKPLKDVISAACFEYWAGGGNWEELKFYLTNWEDAQKLLGFEFSEDVTRITVNSNFYLKK